STGPPLLTRRRHSAQIDTPSTGARTFADYASKGGILANERAQGWITLILAADAIHFKDSLGFSHCYRTEFWPGHRQEWPFRAPKRQKNPALLMNKLSAAVNLVYGWFTMPFAVEFQLDMTGARSGRPAF
ncbi:MAG: hypothetical protein O7C63_02685, partial [Alphaproteobacteria bacterium]|nr:hypothetical protein [Alphaproteobacteria bacterium]